MKDEIKQNGQVILSSDDGISIPMIYNNLAGVNMQSVEYRVRECEVNPRLQHAGVCEQHERVADIAIPRQPEQVCIFPEHALDAIRMCL